MKDLTSAVKLFLRALHEPLLTKHNRKLFLAAALTSDSTLLKKHVRDLPIANRDTLCFMMLHLQRLAVNERETKMNLQNFATSFGDTFYGSDETIEISDVNNFALVNLQLLSLETSFYEETLQLTIDKLLFGRETISSSDLTIKRDAINKNL
uniref:Rac GTPase-activating protein 1 (Trinotate prediction) n=1 Tax=Henneguya salminicola TaxID=69463 RepID=A0A6G3MKK2_HENSL